MVCVFLLYVLPCSLFLEPFNLSNVSTLSNPPFSDTPRGDLLHTLCCWSPFVQKHPPFELRHIITAFVDCCMILLILLLVGYYYSDYYIFIVYTTEGSLEHGMMFLTCSVWGEEHSSYRPTFGLLRFILLSLMFWWSLVHMICTFVVPLLLLLSRACRTLVVWYVGDDGVVLWCLVVGHRCLIYRRRWWGCQSWPLFSPWRLEAIYFLRKRRSGPPDSYRWLLDVLQSSNLIYYAIDQYCW